jgi:hypothetical protein
VDSRRENLERACGVIVDMTTERSSGALPQMVTEIGRRFMWRTEFFGRMPERPVVIIPAHYSCLGNGAQHRVCESEEEIQRNGSIHFLVPPRKTRTRGCADRWLSSPRLIMDGRHHLT